MQKLQQYGGDLKRGDDMTEIEADGFITVHVWPPTARFSTRQRRLAMKRIAESNRRVFRTMTERLLAEASHATGLSPSRLTGRERNNRVFVPRAAICWVLRENGLGMAEIGRRIGGRDHTTIIHACRRAEELRTTDPSFRGLCAQLQASLK